jgi:hypothetical protein
MAHQARDRLGHPPRLPDFAPFGGSQEVVDYRISNLAAETITSGQVKPEMLSSKNTAEGRFLCRF